MVRAVLARGNNLSLPGVTLIPRIPDESGEDGKQVESVRVVVLVNNAFITHGMDESCVLQKRM